jgi:putative addiction module component (TIGR02574 family)
MDVKGKAARIGFFATRFVQANNRDGAELLAIDLIRGDKGAIDVGHLSKDERLDLIEQLWDSLSDQERESLPLTAEQGQELDRRLDAMEREGPVGTSPDELRRQVRGRSS